MKDFVLETKTKCINIEVLHDSIWVWAGIDGSYQLDKSHYQKLKSYKSVSALLKYAKANQLDTPSHPSHDLPSDDSLGGVSPSSSVELHPSNDALTDDSHSSVQSPIINSDVAFENGSLAGESSPVAASSYPATSDTPFILKHYPQTCSQCKTSLSDFNTNDLNPICNACLWFSEDVDETDLYEDDRDKTYPLETPKFKTKSSYLAVLS